MSTFRFPDNTVLCNFAAVGCLDLLRAKRAAVSVAGRVRLEPEVELSGGRLSRVVRLLSSQSRKVKAVRMSRWSVAAL